MFAFLDNILVCTIICETREGEFLPTISAPNCPFN